MNKKQVVLILSFIVVFTLTACGQELPQGKETTPADDQSVQMVDASAILLNASQEFFQEEKTKMVSASEIFEKVMMNPDPHYYVVDLRSQEEFLAASIMGAVNIPFETSWQQEQIAKLPHDKTIVLISKTGALANQTAAFWGMLGYEVIVMSNGMSGWENKEAEECGLEDLPVITEAAVAADQHLIPSVQLETDGSLIDILIKQNKEIFTVKENWQLTVEQVKQLVTSHHEDYYLVDIRDAEHYKSGHISGALNIPLAQLFSEENLRKLPPDKELIIVCYTGNTANQVARVLGQLGYTSTAMEYGMSGWTSKVDVIGVQPTQCAWVKCYSDDNFARGFPVEAVECEWTELPTVVTRLQLIEDGG